MFPNIGLQRALALAELAAATPQDKPIVEIGVWRGGSALYLYDVAKKQGRALHLFDTFNGIPFCDSGDYHRIGDFGGVRLRDLKTLMPTATLHVGVFPDTLPHDFGPVSFIHCDVDQQRSVCAVIDYMFPLLVPGGIIVFDDMDQAACAEIIHNKFGSSLMHVNKLWFVRRQRNV